MSQPIEVPEAAMSEAITALRSESHRGAAILGGSMVDNSLANFLAAYCRERADKSTVEKLFGASGPISTFAQRILVARAFGFIDARKQKQLGLIREIRNHFAHHPLVASFDDQYVKVRVENLPFTPFTSANPAFAEAGTHRMGYILACAAQTARFQVMAEHVHTMFGVQTSGEA